MSRMLSLVGWAIVDGCGIGHVVGVDSGRVVDQRRPVGGLPELARGDGVGDVVDGHGHDGAERDATQGEALGGRVRKSDKTLTDEELNTFLEQSLSARIKEAELEKTYYLRCRTVLSVQKAVRLPHVCRAFARRFFEQHKH